MVDPSKLVYDNNNWQVHLELAETKKKLELNIDTGRYNLVVNCEKCFDCEIKIVQRETVTIVGLLYSKVLDLDVLRLDIENSDLSLIEINSISEIFIKKCTRLNKLKGTIKSVYFDGMSDFQGFHKLRYKTLIFRNMEYLPLIQNSTVKSLYILNLANSDLSNINCPNLRSLTIEESRITGEFPNVDLHVDECNLAKLDYTFQITPNVKSIHITNTLLESITIENKDHKLEFLEIQNNQIKHLKIKDPRNICINVKNNQLQSLPNFRFTERIPTLEDIKTLKDINYVIKELSYITRYGIEASNNPLVYPNGEKYDPKTDIIDYCLECERQLRDMKKKSAAK